jgi:hypothetical protein
MQKLFPNLTSLPVGNVRLGHVLSSHANKNPADQYPAEEMKQIIKERLLKAP